VIGLATRPAAAVLAFTMTIAAFVVLRDKPFAMKEMAILYLIPAVVILIMGAGKYSFDAAISIEKKRMFR
jgi:putative oxidoreductase